MSKSTVTGVVVVAVIILLVILFGGRGNDDAEVISDDERDSFAPAEVEAFHSYSGGTHMVAGTIDLPTPCHTLETRAVVRESFPEQVTIEIETTVDEEVVCAQVITPTEFSVEFSASEDAHIDATFNGASVPLELSDLESDAFNTGA